MPLERRVSVQEGMHTMSTFGCCKHPTLMLRTNAGPSGSTGEGADEVL